MLWKQTSTLNLLKVISEYKLTYVYYLGSGYL
jgi:hypothetical protein